MKIRKTVGLFVIFSASLLLLTGCGTTNNSQGNNQNVNTAVSSDDKQGELKSEEQIIQKTDTEAKNNLSQTGIEAGDNLNDAKDNGEEVKKEEIKYFRVIKVVDGDTIAVDIEGVSETIRLIGINTPETVDPRKPVECFGIEASNKAKELLSGKSVALEKDSSQDERDKYGRLLRYIKTKDGLFYNLEIIKQGYAYEYTYGIPYKYQREFKEAENYARTKKLGLWADGVCGEKNIDSPATVPVAPEIKPTEIIVKPPEIKAQCECSSNKYNCGDFKTQVEAQALFECCGGTSNDIHRLDSDKDGKVCESLP